MPMKWKNSNKMTESLTKMLTCSASVLLLAIIVICPVTGSEVAAVAVTKLTDSSHSSHFVPKRQVPSPNHHAQAQPYPYTNTRHYNEQRGDIRDTTSRHNQNSFQRRADVGSDNKRLSDNHNYNGNRFLHTNNDVASGQKQNSQDFYDPFYFFQHENRGQLNQLSQPNPHTNQPLYQRQRGDLNTNTNVNPPRNRRNSHNINSQNDYFDLNAEKYNILTKTAYPLDNHNAYANSYPTSYRSHHHAHHHNPNQFLSQDQLQRQGTNRHVHGSNSLDYYGGGGAHSNGGRGDVPWSVQIGTQLKVNDDGRAPNPTQFYIRDERTGPPHRRHPIYRK